MCYGVLTNANTIGLWEVVTRLKHILGERLAGRNGTGAYRRFRSVRHGPIAPHDDPGGGAAQLSPEEVTSSNARYRGRCVPRIMAAPLERGSTRDSGVIHHLLHLLFTFDIRAS